MSFLGKVFLAIAIGFLGGTVHALYDIYSGRMD